MARKPRTLRVKPKKIRPGKTGSDKPLEPEEITRLIEQLLQSNDTALVLQAEEALIACKSRKGSLKNFLVITNSPNPLIRQWAYYLTDQIIIRDYLTLGSDEGKQLRADLLTKFQEEPDLNVKKQIAEVIGKLAYIFLPASIWIAVLDFIVELFESEDATKMEDGLVLLHVISPFLSERFFDEAWIIFNHFLVHFLESKDSRLVALTKETVRKTAGNIELTIKFFKEYPNMIPVVFDLDDEGDIDLVSEIYSIFIKHSDLLTIKETFGNYVFMLAKKAIRMAFEYDQTDEDRLWSIGFLDLYIVQQMLPEIQKQFSIVLVENLIKSGIEVLAWDPIKRLEEQETTAERVGFSLLNNVMIKIPAEVAFPAYMKCFEGVAESKNPNKRAVPLLTIEKMVHSDILKNPELRKKNLEVLSDYLARAVLDPFDDIVMIAVQNIHSFCEYEQDFTDHHAKLLPSMLEAISRLNHGCQNEGKGDMLLVTLDRYCSNMEVEVKHAYATQILSILTRLISNEEICSDLRQQCLSTTFRFVSKEMQKQVALVRNELYLALNSIILKNQDELMMIKAAECFSEIVRISPHDTFSADLIQPFMTFAFAQIKSFNTCMLQDEIIKFFERMVDHGESEVYKQVASIFIDLIPPLYHDPSSSDTEEASARIDSIGIFASKYELVAKANLAKIVKAFKPLQGIPKVKEELIEAYFSVALGLVKTSLNDDALMNYSRGEGGAPLPFEVSKYLSNIVLPYYIKILKEGSSPQIIFLVVDLLRRMTIIFGPSAFAEVLPKLTSFVCLVLQKKNPIRNETGNQAKDDVSMSSTDSSGDVSFSDEEEGEQLEVSILDRTLDLACQLGMVFYNDFYPAYKTIFEHILPYLKEDCEESRDDRKSVFSCFASLIETTPKIAEEQFDEAWTLVKTISEKGEVDAGDTALAVGALAMNGGVQFRSKIEEALQILEGLGRSDESQEVKDSIIIAKCQILHFQMLPLPTDQRHPEYANLLKLVLESMPMAGILNENQTLLKMALELYSADKPTFDQYKEKIDLTFHECLFNHEDIQDIVKTEFMIGFLPFLRAKATGPAAAYLEEQRALMSPEHKDKFSRLMS